MLDERRALLASATRRAIRGGKVLDAVEARSATDAERADACGTMQVQSIWTVTVCCA